MSSVSGFCLYLNPDSSQVPNFVVFIVSTTRSDREDQEVKGVRGFLGLQRHGKHDTELSFWPIQVNLF